MKRYLSPMKPNVPKRNRRKRSPSKTSIQEQIVDVSISKRGRKIFSPRPMVDPDEVIKSIRRTASPVRKASPNRNPTERGRSVRKTRHGRTVKTPQKSLFSDGQVEQKKTIRRTASPRSLDASVKVSVETEAEDPSAFTSEDPRENRQREPRSSVFPFRDLSLEARNVRFARKSTTRLSPVKKHSPLRNVIPRSSALKEQATTSHISSSSRQSFSTANNKGTKPLARRRRPMTSTVPSKTKSKKSIPSRKKVNSK